MTSLEQPFIIGWQEWVALPDLGLPAIKAKIDTGARSSALHAFLIEPYGPAEAPMVRFGVHPIPGRADIEIYCAAPVVDRREVTSSNGEKETRFFIRTPVRMGSRTWPIDIGLTNRGSMTYRMLLGRHAVRSDMMVDPSASFRQPRLSSRLYRNQPRETRAHRPLRIVLVARRTELASTRRLATAAAARGHQMDRLELDRLTLDFEGTRPGLRLGTRAVEHYDAVVPRLGAAEGRAGAAIVRQLEMMGSYAVNSGDALDLAGNPLALVQALARKGIAHAMEGGEGRGPPRRSAQRVDRLRLLVIGRRVSAGILSGADGSETAAALRKHRIAARLAVRAAQALGLGLASIVIDEAGEVPRVVGVSARPALGRYEAVCGSDVSSELLALIEARVRSAVRSTGMPPYAGTDLA